jgi:hypothetical protein
MSTNVPQQKEINWKSLILIQFILAFFKFFIITVADCILLLESIVELHKKV